ncbi:MAG: rhodanese-like domain-containing protein, partial [Rhodospirillales bacterium]|nr:rhodanese-like domain-containing protein [Rhodospirillales bacterium]
HHLPLSAFDPSHLPEHGGKIVVYHCASGGRTSRFGPQLAAATRAASDVFHMGGGIIAWKSAGFATEG